MRTYFRIIVIAIFVLVDCGLSAKSKPKCVLICNTADTLLIDQPIVIQRQNICFESTNLLPALLDQYGRWIPSQVDDINGDGAWDELAFLLTLTKSEKKRLTIKWVSANQYPQFKQRANVRYGKMTTPGKVVELTKDVHGKNNLRGTFGYPYQMDGIAWENDKMGYRHYFDGRNCRDLFGKKTDKMVLDNVGIKPDGFPGDTYHVMADWGRDILSVGQSFGLGGLALMQGDSLVRLGVLANQTVDIVDSTRYTLINKGVVRALFRLDFEGWNIGTQKINFSQIVTIWGGSYGCENQIVYSKLPENCAFVTGLVHNNNNQPFQSECFYGQKAMITHDKQSYNKEFTIGLALLVPNQNFVNAFDTPDKGSGIIYTWCAKLKPGDNHSIKYNVLAAWELQNNAFLDRQFFVNTVKYEALKLSRRFVIKIK
ncbi:MAG: DUF4861 domain-containing protein [Bacteroidales bacterium]